MKGRPILLSAACCILSVYAASASVFYVDGNSTNPMPPYTDWTTAATQIQDAVDASRAGDLVLVTNGVYSTGGRNWGFSGTNLVTLTNSILLQSVNGPSVTWIVGNRVTGTGSVRTNTVRCVGMGNNAVLSGFTLTNGEAGMGNYPAGGGVAYIYGSGGGTVTNCILIGNLATNSAGGGAYRVTLINCQIVGNSAGFGGGACACTQINCIITSNTAATGGGVYGGGAFGASFLTHCTIIGNSASSSAGGAFGGTLNACSISNNTASNGGGMYGSTLNNCLVSGNSAGSGGGAYGGIITNCTVVANLATNSGGGIFGGTGAYGFNSIIYDNTAPSGSNNIGTKFVNCCTIPNLSGGGITNEPLFENLTGGDYHLQSSSPCINAGNNSYVSATNDLDGNPRIVGGTVDVGAYEYQTPTSIISYAWLQQYGLPTNGSADFADLDGNGMNIYQDWVAGLNPTNAASVLALYPPASANTTGLTVTWQSVNNRKYYLQSSTNLSSSPTFISIQSNIVGQAGSTSFTDTTATNSGPYFYRVGVQ
jgi:hypothetical protein